MLKIYTFIAYYCYNIVHENEKKEDVIQSLFKSNQLLLRKVRQLTKELNSHKKTCTCKTPIDQRIIKTDKDVLFYTGIKSKALFDKFFEYIKPLVKRKWRGPSVKGSIIRHFKNSPKKIGPKLKLSGREEFLLCLIKIRLVFFHEDLANRFSISKTLASRIFSTGVKATAAVLKSLVFIPKCKILLPLELINLVNFYNYIPLLMPLRFF